MVGPKNRLRDCDIHKIVDVFNRRDESNPKYARMVSIEEIEKNDFNLNIPRYIDSQQAEDIQDIEGHLKGGIGWGGAFRRSELVGLTWDCVTWLDSGMELLLRSSKVDQAGAGFVKFIPTATIMQSARNCSTGRARTVLVRQPRPGGVISKAPEPAGNLHHCYFGLPQRRIPPCHNVPTICFFGAICGSGPITSLTLMQGWLRP